MLRNRPHPCRENHRRCPRASRQSQGDPPRRKRHGPGATLLGKRPTRSSRCRHGSSHRQPASPIPAHAREGQHNLQARNRTCWTTGTALCCRPSAHEARARLSGRGLRVSRVLPHCRRPATEHRFHERRKQPTAACKDWRTQRGRPCRHLPGRQLPPSQWGWRNRSRRSSVPATSPRVPSRVPDWGCTSRHRKAPREAAA
mmetsp:Transcript_157673/g.505648  ORF Transcript_157673/g.505648 Transcript_157673/m.505648 type:complete len:200 (-) Transcript_157673:1407-2006(-)